MNIQLEKYRYDTKFFVTELASESSSSAQIDNTEVTSLTWVSPDEALELFKKGTVSFTLYFFLFMKVDNRYINLPPPTWITLYHVSKFHKLDDFISHSNSRTPYDPSTPITKQTILPYFPITLEDENNKLVLVLPGDEAYSKKELAGSVGKRHRMILSNSSFKYENSEFSETLHPKL